MRCDDLEAWLGHGGDWFRMMGFPHVVAEIMGIFMDFSWEYHEFLEAREMLMAMGCCSFQPLLVDDFLGKTCRDDMM